MAEKRNFIVYAELSAKELEVLRDVCRRQQRSTGFVAGQIIRAWLERQTVAATADKGAECTVLNQ